MWERYCRDSNAIVYLFPLFPSITSTTIVLTLPSNRFVVDSTDRPALPVATEELQTLLALPSLEGIPLLVLGNKSDLDGHMGVDELIEALELKKVSKREVSCYGISAKEETNLEAVLKWLVARSGKGAH